MIWVICLVVSLLSVAIAGCTALWMGRQDKKGWGFFTPYRIFFLGMYVCVVVALLPVYRALLSAETVGGFKSLLIALYNAFQVFTANTDGAMILENIHRPGNPIDEVYYFYMIALFIASPVMTFSFLVSLLRNVVPGFRYALVRSRDTYAFSALNERSLALGRDLRSKYGNRAVLIYANVNKDDMPPQLVDEAEALHAICFHGDLPSVDMHSRRERQLTLFVIGDDPAENNQTAMRLIERYGEVKGATMYLFAEDAISELLLPQMHEKAMTVRRVNEKQMLVDDLLVRHGKELFAAAAPSGDEKLIHAVFVGLGRYGTEMLKSLTWYAQMDGYRLEIDAYDADETAEDRFTAQCPELMDPGYNGHSIPGEAQYSIRIHSGVDVNATALVREIAAMKDATYCFIDLGEDDRNIDAALKMRMLFERGKSKPVIHAVIGDADRKRLVENAVHFSGKPYQIIGVGDLESLYTEAGVINNELQQEALACHLRWGEEPTFWQYEYHFRSSMASAIHIHARMDCGIPGADKSEDKLTDEERARIEALEHRRWNAYMRANGYVYSGSPAKATRNDLARMHNNLVCYEELEADVKRKDSRVGLKN